MNDNSGAALKRGEVFFIKAIKMWSAFKRRGRPTTAFCLMLILSGCGSGIRKPAPPGVDSLLAQLKGSVLELQRASSEDPRMGGGLMDQLTDRIQSLRMAHETEFSADQLEIFAELEEKIAELRPRMTGTRSSTAITSGLKDLVTIAERFPQPAQFD